MNETTNQAKLTRLGPLVQGFVRAFSARIFGPCGALIRTSRVVSRAVLLTLMAIYAAGIGHATIVPIPIDDDLNIYIPCTDVSGTTETGGVTITATPGGQTTTSDASGNYKLLCLPIGDHTLTPTKSGTTFVPAARLVSVPTAEDITIANISFNFGRTISGNVGIDGTTITLMNGSLVIGTTTSDINGNYSFGSVGPGTFTLSVSKDQTTFSPASQTVSVVVGGATQVSASFALTSSNVPGAIAGQFSVSASGAATYSIPIQAPLGTAGMQPGLALSYSSQAGNGLAGMGWGLSGFSAITRCSKTLAQDGVKTAITLTNNDVFCLDGQRLMAVVGAYGGNGTEYRTEIESFSRVISSGTQGAGPYSFTVETKSGQILHYTPIVSAGQTTAHQWALNLVRDKFANCMSVTYALGVSGQELYPANVYYSGRYNAGTAVCDSTYNSIAISYDVRTDTSSGYFGPAITKQTQRISKIETYGPTGLVSRYVLSYGTGPALGRSRLASVTQFGSDSVTSLPATTFSYLDGGGGISVSNNMTVVQNANAFGSNYTIVPGDFNGDGNTDIYLIGPSVTYFCSGPGIATANNCQQTSGYNFVGFVPLTGDFDGDGFTDFYFIGTSGGSYFCKGKSTLPGSTCVQTTTANLSNKTFSVGDVNGDGISDLIQVESGTASLLRVCIGPAISSSLTLASCPGATIPNSSFASNFKMLPSDLDGDGVTEIQLNYTTPTTVYGSLPHSANCRYTTTLTCVAGLLDAYPVNAITTGDFNGDGYTDMILVSTNNTAGNWLFCPGPSASPGNNCVNMSKLSNGASSVGGFKLKIYPMDFNGDGISDLMITDDIQNSSSNTWFCKGPGLISANNCTLPLWGTAGWIGNLTPWPGDYNGDGVTDLILSSSGNTQFAAGGVQPDKLVSATNGLGATTSVTYKPLTDLSIFGVYTKGSGSTYPTIDIQVPLHVVASAGSSNGIGGTTTTNYFYSALRADLKGRGLLGFGSVTARSPSADFNNQIVETEYYQSYPFSGMVYKKLLKVNNPFTGSTRILNILFNTATIQGPLASPLQSTTGSTRYFSYVDAVSDASYDYVTGSLVTSSQTNFQYADGWGNPTGVSVSTNDGYGGTTTNTYLNNAASWTIGRLTASTASRTSPAGLTVTKNASFTVDGNTGVMTQEIIEPSNPSLKVITDHGYDVYGHQTSTTVRTDLASTDPAYFAPRTSYTYFAAQGLNPAGRFATSVVNALGQTETREYDPRFGVMITLVGPNNLPTSSTYDTLGRLKTETRADGTISSVTYAFYSDSALPTARYSVTSQSTGQPTKLGYFDLLNRNLRSAVSDFSGAGYVISGVKDFDAYGRVTRAYRNYSNVDPTAPAGSTLSSTFVYDPLGRVVTTMDPNGLSATNSYNGLTATATANNSTGAQTTSKTVNSQGWATSTTDASGKVTNFGYDPNGSLLTTTDPKGNIVSMTYDLKGRKTGMNDPDMGAWTYAYDALGQLKSQTDAKAQTTTMVYDLLGRMTQRSEPSLISNYYYDKYANNTACNKGVGKLCEVTAGNGYRRVHYYDNLGRSNRSDHYIDGTTAFQQMDTTFDNIGRVDTVSYPAVTIGTTTTRLAVKNNYNAAGYLFKITNPEGTLAYWTANTIDADGHVTSETLGNGLTTARTYQNTTGRLTAIDTNNGATQNMGFAYDTLGNLTSRTDAFITPSIATINENYSYDVLNRLKTVTMSGATSLTKSYNYDEIGNILTKSDIGGTGAYTYLPSGVGSVRPHAVSSVNGTIGGVVNPNYTYDANGNMITAFAGTRVITYASFNLPTQIARSGTTVSWVYDADHVRTKETSNAGLTGQAATVYYLNAGSQALFEKHIGIVGTGLTEYRHFIGGVAVYTQKSNATAETKYLLKDHLGSTTVVTNSAGVVLERYSYDPFGKTRNLNGSDIATAATMPAPSVRRGFTDHEMMPEFAGGLIHMNGRIYDPNLGRFMTADPHVQAAGYSQSYNRYAYGFNNPLSGTDPSGYSFNLFDPFDILGSGGGWLNPGSSQWDALHGAIQNWAKNPIDNFNLYALERAMPGRATMDNFMISHEWAMDLGHAALAFASAFCYAGAAACYAAMEAHVAGYMTWLGGGSHEDAFGNMIEAGAIAFVSASANYAIGQGLNTNGAGVSAGTRIGNVLAHAALGCAMAEAGGGKCGAGALSGAITAGVDQIQTGSFAGGFAMAMIAGCAGSAAGGGSCSRGGGFFGVDLFVQ